jgi:7,8-dihydro-6-hydroxymethylpterin-pyrophosphokinase
MNKAVLEISSGFGNRESNISSAIHSLELLPNTTVIAGSGIYESKSDNAGEKQIAHLSKCVVALTELSPRVLLGACLGIEVMAADAQDERLNRKKAVVYLLIYEGAASSDTELILPYVKMINKPAALVSLRELFRDNKALDYDFSSALKRIDLSNVKLF